MNMEGEGDKDMSCFLGVPDRCQHWPGRWPLLMVLSQEESYRFLYLKTTTTTTTKPYRTSALVSYHPSRVDLGPPCLESYLEAIAATVESPSGFVSSLLGSQKGRQHLLGPAQRWKYAELHGPASLSLCSSLVQSVTSVRVSSPTVKHTFTRAMQTTPVLPNAKRIWGTRGISSPKRYHALSAWGLSGL